MIQQLHADRLRSGQEKKKISKLQIKLVLENRSEKN